MTVRYVNAGDDPADISDIYERSWKHAYKGIIPQDFLDSIPHGKWVKHLSKPDMRHLVIEDGGKLVGTASVCASRWEDFKGFGEVVSIYLIPEFMGKGYGSELFARCISELADMGYGSVMLWVLEDNERARKFYERHGFTLTDKRLDDNIGGKDLREAAYILNK